MIRTAMATFFVLVLAGTATAADKEVKGVIIKVDAKASQIVVKTDDGEKTYDVNDETKFLGPKGGVSAERLKDDRLVKGAEVTLLVAGNNKTAREVRLPERVKKP